MAADAASGGRSVHGSAADAGLRLLFAVNARAPWLLAALERPLLAASRVAFRERLRAGIRANAPFLLGPDATAAAVRRLEDGVLRSFFRFVRDVGASGSADRGALQAKVSTVRGREHHAAARAANPGGGLIFATAHLGCFEVGIAALAGLEPNVRVVFQRDPFAAFDDARGRLHRALGVHDAVVGGPDSLEVWADLAERLRGGAAVLVQADRVMPGQRGVRVPFLGGTVELPVGPVKLAGMTGAAIVPVFAVRTPAGVELRLHPPIRVGPADPFPRAGAPVRRSKHSPPRSRRRSERTRTSGWSSRRASTEGDPARRSGPRRGPAASGAEPLPPAPRLLPATAGSRRDPDRANPSAWRPDAHPRDGPGRSYALRRTSPPPRRIVLSHETTNHDAPEIVISGRALACALGVDRHTAWARLIAGDGDPTELTALEPHPGGPRTGYQAGSLPADAGTDDLPREVAYLRHVIAAALDDAGVGPGTVAPDRIGVTIGTTLHGMRAAGVALCAGDPSALRRFQGAAVLQAALAGLPVEVSGLGVTGCAACSSGLSSLGLARDLLEDGSLDVVIAGGYDTVSEYAYGGFHALRLISDNGVRPFARDRRGMMLGEGYGMLVLETAAHAEARGHSRRSASRASARAATPTTSPSPTPPAAAPPGPSRPASKRLAASPPASAWSVPTARARRATRRARPPRWHPPSAERWRAMKPRATSRRCGSSGSRAGWATRSAVPVPSSWCSPRTRSRRRSSRRPRTWPPPTSSRPPSPEPC